MNPRDSLSVADDLVNGMAEAEWRSAASRAYYAAFHVAREFFSQRGFAVPRGEQAHAYLWLRLSNAGHTDVARVGTDLNTLRQLRNRADYDLNQSFDHPIAAGAVLVGDGIVKQLDLVPTLPALQLQIIDNIRMYERDVLGQVTWHP